MYDLIIIGGGPGGVAAGVYAARKKIKSALIADSFGGQSFSSPDIQNWIGIKSISGFDLAKSMEEHLRAQEGIDIFEDLASEVRKENDFFSVLTKNGKIFNTKTILVVSGSRRRKLGVPGEEKFDGKGVAYCSTCDAPLFKNKAVAVVGGGNAGLEAVLDLAPYASKIHLLEFSDSLRGDLITQEKIKTDSKVEIIFNAETLEILGDKFVSGLKYKDLKTNGIRNLEVQGVFVEIGSVPNSDFVKDLVRVNKFGEIIIDHKTQAASLPGVWAAGDVSDTLYKQNNISAGDAIKAVLNIQEYLNKK
ncbi:FAD-dependent oxidoreductase [Candidatus Wolfebacteria bacterium]|nr:FAD-dependent oxidoreductase [Candidatus Wolfebacteria bacterium]